jgi:hypothetical protein
MICQIFPPLEGIALDRFHALARQVMQQQRSGRTERLDNLCENEVRWARSQPGLNGSREQYEACARVLVDLARLRWRVQEDRFGFELVSPRGGGFTAQQVQEYKTAVRAELASQLAAQFAQPAAAKFIRQMEKPSAKSGRKPITLLIADGRELRARVLDAADARDAERVARLASAIQPYLQLVVPDAVDEFTGIPLGDIWRYFRYTWTIPATNIPGRQLWYLVRDAAHPHHAIMGIAALSNAPLQLNDRDKAIGWTFDAFREEAEAVLDGKSPASLESLIAQLEANVIRGIAAVDPTNLVRPGQIENPTPELVATLQRRAAEFAETRADILADAVAEMPLVMEELEQNGYLNPPVSDEVLALESKVFGDPKTDSARRALVSKKRAAELARLLQARLTFREFRARFCDSATTRAVLDREDFGVAVSTALLAIKHECAGTNILELTTCGAIRPYNTLLAGKLVALLMLSPQVAADYRRRYGAEPSIISSLMKNAPVRKDSRLVFLGTTSLYTHGVSQYNRLRLPRGIIAPKQDEIRFELLGHTSGFGTVQFPETTMRAVERVLEQHRGYRDVNSIFGEGRSPKLRKLRSGLQLLGFDPGAVLQHHQPRCIYGMRLCAQTGDFLLGKTDALPAYIEGPEQFRDATERVAAFWRERWLASRLDHGPSLAALGELPTWKLSEIVPVPEEASEQPPSTPVGAEASGAAPSSKLELWRSLASAGHDVCSDELSRENLDRLHIPTPLESFIVAKVGEGFSIVLTGNAGDGKTHLLRRLAPSLQGTGAIVEPDATAVMRGESIAPILDRWRSALNANKPYCLAANEYPLYQLRRHGRHHLPLLNEVERQCRHRLAYGPATDVEDAQDRVLVIDLSLRNPLGRDFTGAALDKILNESVVREHAASNADETFTWNHKHLANATVRERILALFERVASRGHRCSVRELWIVLARLLFASDAGEGEPALAARTWYSERLFESDDRFQLSGLLGRFADPARCSHPQWDRRVEDADGTLPSDWLVDNQVPPLDRRALDRARFAALKRRFYFEHRHGDHAFDLEPSDARAFLDILHEAATPDEVFKQKIIAAINRSYCPKQFDGSKQNLHLWIGHRFHEQPSRCFMANQSLPASAFDVFVPRLPRRLSGALTYRPDHLVLEHRAPEETCRLKIDYPLYATLTQIAAGFPRHLAAERDLNRLDAFMDELKSLNPERKRQFVSFSSENRVVNRITLSADFRQYTEVENL